MQNQQVWRLYYEPFLSMNWKPVPPVIAQIQPGATALLEREIQSKYNPIESLSPREREVVHLILKGYTVADIGEYLYISTGTAKTHKNNIYQKLGINTKRQLFELSMAG